MLPTPAAPGLSDGAAAFCRDHQADVLISTAGGPTINRCMRTPQVHQPLATVAVLGDGDHHVAPAACSTSALSAWSSFQVPDLR